MLQAAESHGWSTALPAQSQTDLSEASGASGGLQPMDPIFEMPAVDPNFEMPALEEMDTSAAPSQPIEIDLTELTTQQLHMKHFNDHYQRQVCSCSMLML